MKPTASKRYPEYKRVYDALLEKITGGTYPAGSLLPPEPELEQMFRVSRTTVRKAVELLSKQGLVIVRQGYGTQVVNSKPVQNLNKFTSISQTLTNMGYEIGTKSIYIEPLCAGEGLAESLAVPVGTPLFCINRIQTAGASPIAIAKNYIPCEFTPGLEKTKTKILSWYAYLNEHYGVHLTAARDVISACNATFEESELLQIAPGSALITIRRVCSNESGPVEVDVVKIVASRYEFEVFMQG